MSRFETATITLTPLSPLHLGADEPEYGTADLVVGRDLYIVDEDKLATQLAEQGWLEDYLRFFKPSERGQNQLKAFLEERLQGGALRKFAESISAYEKPLRLPESNRFIRNGHGQAYIPGSSVKGATRTAVMWCYFKDGSQPCTDLEKYVSEKLKNYRELKTEVDALRKKHHETQDHRKQNQLKELQKKEKKLKALSEGLREIIGQDLNKKVFQEHDLALPKGRPSVSAGAHTDWMKAIAVTDSGPIPDSGSNAGLKSGANIRVLTLKEDNHAELKIFQTKRGRRESFPKEVYGRWHGNFFIAPSVASTITLDRYLLGTFEEKPPFSSLRELFDCIRRFNRAVWEGEQQYFYKYREDGNTDCGIQQNEKLVKEVISFYKNQQIQKEYLEPPSDTAAQGKETCALRLGYGSGLLGTTLFTLLDSNDRKDIRDLITFKEEKTAPKSRRLVDWGNGHLTPLGWARLEITYHD